MSGPRGVPQLRSLLLRLRQAATVLHPQQQHYPPALARIAIDGGERGGGTPSPFQQQQTRAKRTVRVVLKRDDPVSGGRAGEVVRVPAGRQRLDLFPAGAADYATPRALREARAGGLGGDDDDQAAAAAAQEQQQQRRQQQQEEEEDRRRPTADGGANYEASFAQALQVLESKAVVLRRRGKPASSSSSAAAADGGGGGGGDEQSGGGAARPVTRVTRADVARAVERQLGVALDDRLLLMGDEGIRAFGEYRVPLNVAAPAEEEGLGGARGGGSKKGAGGGAGDAGGGDRRRQAHVRVDVVQTWR